LQKSSPHHIRNPFGVIAGTSAGGLNAAVLASNADNFCNAVYVSEHLWRTIEFEQVFRTEPSTVFYTLSRYIGKLLRPNSNKPLSLLDNRPLAKLIDSIVRFDNIESAIDNGYLKAFSITSSGYASGHSVAFFQAAQEIKNWRRYQRIGLRSNLDVQHLMASCAIPLVFPAIKIGNEYFGDGAVRQMSPLSPALHLGADKLLVIGVSGNHAGKDVSKPTDALYPSLGQIAGHLYNSAFLDSLEYDLEYLEKINYVLTQMSEKEREKKQVRYKEVSCLEISPSECIDTIASNYIDKVPRTVRFFLKALGISANSGSSVLSYVLFQPNFCAELIEMGYKDAFKREAELRAFFELDKE
jgi:NTE family protein